MPPYDPKDLADWFILESRNQNLAITHLKLHKLVYYAQAWSLVLQKQPLFEEDFQAWSSGPILLTIFRAFEYENWEALPLSSTKPVFDTETTDLLNEILRNYGQESVRSLERLVQNEDPWRDARGYLPPELASEKIITKSSITKFYEKLWNQVHA